MRNAGFYKIEDRDCIEWQAKKDRSNILVSDIYISMIELKRESSRNIFPFALWKASCPTKIILFPWLVYHNKNLTWNNLQKRSCQGPSNCMICLANSEDNLHMFLNCPQTQIIWMKLASFFGFPAVSHSSLIEAFEWWGSQNPNWRPIPLITIWFIWKWRNKRIFQNSGEAFGNIIDKIIPYYFSFLQIRPQQKKQQMASSVHQQLICPRAHFDGAAKNGTCACGVFIALSKDLQFSIYWNGGKGTNNRAEAMALHGLLFFCSFMDIGPINDFGDSKIIIDHVNGKKKISNDSLSGWLDRIAALWKSDTFPISHIKRNQNVQADVLSKKGMHAPISIWHLVISMDSCAYEIQPFSMPGI